MFGTQVFSETDKSYSYINALTDAYIQITLADTLSLQLGSLLPALTSACQSFSAPWRTWRRLSSTAPSASSAVHPRPCAMLVSASVLWARKRARSRKFMFWKAVSCSGRRSMVTMSGWRRLMLRIFGASTDFQSLSGSCDLILMKARHGDALLCMLALFMRYEWTW